MASSHYSKAQEIQQLHENSAGWAKHIIKMCREHRRRWYPILCYRGMSGVASATAVAMHLHIQDPGFMFGMVYVRKSHENSHGGDLEMTGIEDVPDGAKRVLVFVDDFVCSGDTRTTCMGAIMEAVESTSFRSQYSYSLVKDLKPVRGSKRLEFVLDVLTNYYPDR